ncbi:hypothetical protein BDN71DRAFT_1431067 [Pleurotus eryngii]|uniref:Uncharacterized protein n=1 Tax=Pleurotus eryngii TaxID=5323 RepID=A0A9P5ZVZ6_PLEER|nr:hypothetical protein BDN71DRAFT_1431067 [Pleurotus eryngii]
MFCKNVSSPRAGPSHENATADEGFKFGFFRVKELSVADVMQYPFNGELIPKFLALSEVHSIELEAMFVSPFIVHELFVNEYQKISHVCGATESIIQGEAVELCFSEACKSKGSDVSEMIRDVVSELLVIRKFADVLNNSGRFAIPFREKRERYFGTELPMKFERCSRHRDWDKTSQGRGIWRSTAPTMISWVRRRIGAMVAVRVRWVVGSSGGRAITTWTTAVSSTVSSRTTSISSRTSTAISAGTTTTVTSWTTTVPTWATAISAGPSPISPRPSIWVLLVRIIGGMQGEFSLCLRQKVATVVLI